MLGLAKPDFIRATLLCYDEQEDEKMKEKKNEENVISIVKKYIGNFPSGTELSVAVIDNNEVNFFGYKKENDIAIVNNEESAFGIGSISKVLSATVLADIVINDELPLNTPLESIYDFSMGKEINDELVNLANHSSGFLSRDNDFEANIETLRDYYASFSDYKVEKTLYDLSLYDEDLFGKYSYSNFGMGLLGYSLSKHYKIPFEQLLRERVFEKYNMINTSTKVETLNNVVKGLDKDGKETDRWNLNTLVAAGGVFSCAKGMANYVCAHFDEENKALNLVRKPTIQVDSEMQVGLGIHIVKGSNDLDVFWHNGGGGGFKSAMEFNIETRSGVVVLSNVSFFNTNHWDIDRTCTEIMNNLIKKNV